MNKYVATLLLIVCSAFTKVWSEESFVEGKLTGQLGNQMFVIAATVALALEHNAIPIFPDFLSDPANGIPINYHYVFKHLNTQRPNLPFHDYKEPCFQYTPIPYVKNIRLQGYFQSEKYFKAYKDDIIKLFEPSEATKKFLERKYSRLLAKPNKVAIHIRSYHKEDPHQKVYIQMGREYILKAIQFFPKDFTFIIFTNDICFAKQELRGLPYHFHLVRKEKYFYDFYLMSMCDHHIISNSSFSWWSAYLNKNPHKKVIVPAIWFNRIDNPFNLSEDDLIPAEWIKI